MKGTYNYIVGTDTRYHNKVDVEGTELIVNTEITERDHHFVNRIGVIKATPINDFLAIREGDEVLLHHNVFRKWYDIRGKLKESSNWFKDDEFFVYPDQLSAYKRDGEWHALDRYCFVKPIPSEDVWSPLTHRIDRGTVEYSNSVLTPYGVSKGCLVGFRPDEFVEINIEGQKLYRILSNHITINYGHSKEEGASCTCGRERDRRTDQSDEQEDGCERDRSRESESICVCV